MARWFLDRPRSEGFPRSAFVDCCPTPSSWGARTGKCRAARPTPVNSTPARCSWPFGAIGPMATPSSPGPSSMARRAWSSSSLAPRPAGSRSSSPIAGRPSPGSATPWRAARPTRSAAIGVAGRRGKGATGLFLRSIFEADGESVGSIGRSSWSDGASTRPTGPDSPRPDGIASMLRAMVERRCDSAILELEDEALDRREVDGLAFEAAVITSLGSPTASTDGPDREALIRRNERSPGWPGGSAGGSVVINADEPEADLLGAVNLDAPTGHLRPRTSRPRLGDPRSARPGRPRFRLRGFDREATITLRLAGEEHVAHALAASAVAWSRGLSLEAVVDGLESVTGLPGRLEPVAEGQDFEVRVDQARTRS